MTPLLGGIPELINQRWVSYHPVVSISNQSRELVKIQWGYQTPAVCFNLNHEFETIVKNTGDPYCWGQRVILPPCTRDYKLVGDLDCNRQSKASTWQWNFFFKEVDHIPDVKHHQTSLKNILKPMWNHQPAWLQAPCCAHPCCACTARHMLFTGSEFRRQLLSQVWRRSFWVDLGW